jgi:hypothetical protein
VGDAADLLGDVLVPGPRGPELDEVHRRQHQPPPEHDPRPEPLAAEQHREQPGPHRLHRHDDRRAGGVQVRLRPGLHDQRERPATSAM